MNKLEKTLYSAIQRREKLSAVTNAMRLVNGAGDGLDGVLIDRYNKHLHVQFLEDHWLKQQNEICRLLTSRLSVDYLIVKTRHGLEIKEEVLVPGEAQTIVQEHGVQFQVHLNDGLNCGLFLDMRHNRRMVSQSLKDKKVLNCFAYTCSFGVHARLGGAREVVNTDISRRVLERGKNNYQLNALTVLPGEFIQADSVAYLQRAFKKGNQFDAIILDPPSFARHEGKVFQVKRDLPKLMALAVAVLNPGGCLLVSTNYSEISHADLERILAKGLNGRRAAHIRRVGQDEDFCGSNSFKESYLVGLWVKFL
jgi:23S rRNA (cytosine1962-C5)-methyltransferase